MLGTVGIQKHKNIQTNHLCRKNRIQFLLMMYYGCNDITVGEIQRFEERLERICLVKN